MSVPRNAAYWSSFLAFGLLVVLVAPLITPDLTAGTAFGQASAGATLSVLAPPVEVAQRGGAFSAARDGMSLAPGDQVRTTGSGVALLTFFDGSEIQLTPDSQIQVQQASPSATGPQINVTQIAGTTVDRVQRIASQPTNFSTNTPAATAVVRGTRYVITVKCYTSPPALPATRLLTFPRRLSGAPYLLADEVIYDDGGMLWVARAWQDATTGESFNTYDQLGATYPEIAESVYQEEDGSFWLDREWQDPDSGETWQTYEDVGVPADDLQAAALAVTRVMAQPVPVGQAQAGCHPVTSIVDIEGRVGLQPTTSTLTGFDITPGLAGAASGRDAVCAGGGAPQSPACG